MPAVPLIPSEFPNCPFVECTDPTDGFEYFRYSCFMESFEEESWIPEVGPVRYRIPTFVTVPKNVECPMPLLVMLHSWGDDRSFYIDSPSVTLEDDWNALTFAKEGYAVLTLTSRGHFDSPSGLRASELNSQARYWARFNDPSWDVRDVQEVISKLVTARLASPEQIAVTGTCLGGGQSMMLALLNDQVIPHDAAQQQWETPEGTVLKIAASIPWEYRSSLTHGLIPNGRMTDQKLTTKTELNCPFGVPVEEFWGVLFAGVVELAPPDLDESADFLSWYVRMTQGSPYYDDSSKNWCAPSDDIVKEMIDEFDRRSLLFVEPYVPVPDVPVYQVFGLTDSLAPATQGVQMIYRLQQLNPDYPIKSFFGNLHHAFGPVDTHWEQARKAGRAFLNYHMRGIGGEPASDITVATTVCGGESPGENPPDYRESTEFVVTDWASLSNSLVTFNSDDLQTTRSPSPDDPAFNPLANEPLPNCMTIPVSPGEGTAWWNLDLLNDFTMAGSPGLTITFNTDAVDVQLNGILWKLEPGGKEKTLISYGAYRHLGSPNPTGDPQTIPQYQLSPNAWTFDAGTKFRLEIRSDARPHFKPNNTPSITDISSVTLTLPGRCKLGCFGDFNCDGDVNVIDLRAVILGWGTPNADVDGDGLTNVNDLRLIILNWGLCD